MTAESRCGSTSQVGYKTETQPCIANHLRAQLFIHNFSKISLQLFTHKLFKIFLHMFINKLSKICKGGKGRTQHCTTSHPPGLFTHKRLKREKEEERLRGGKGRWRPRCLSPYPTPQTFCSLT